MWEKKNCTYLWQTEKLNEIILLPCSDKRVTYDGSTRRCLTRVLPHQARSQAVQKSIWDSLAHNNRMLLSKITPKDYGEWQRSKDPGRSISWQTQQDDGQRGMQIEIKQNFIAIIPLISWELEEKNRRQMMIAVGTVILGTLRKTKDLKEIKIFLKVSASVLLVVMKALWAAVPYLEKWLQ